MPGKSRQLRNAVYRRWKLERFSLRFIAASMRESITMKNSSNTSKKNCKSKKRLKINLIIVRIVWAFPVKLIVFFSFQLTITLKILQCK